MKELPKKYKHQEVETRLSQAWDAQGTYRWDADCARENTFVVDTPPPTVSGSLHIGHVFSYTHTDLIVRYQRMRGRNIMYPMGWDDNGLPTERRVQNTFGISCNPRLHYQADWKPTRAASGKKADARKPLEVSRNNFIEACQVLTQEDEQAFEELWRNIGLSVDWSEQYATIDSHCRMVSQSSFLDLHKKSLVYSAESPTMWDVGYQTALAQADIEDREMTGAYHDIRFGIDGGGEFIISTTRPELLVACIAVVAHPDDARYQQYFGAFAITPLYHARVPILASEHADPEKGSGIMMVCTFGDAADVDWWKASGQAIKQVLDKKGCFIGLDFEQGSFKSQQPEVAKRYYEEIVGRSSTQARKIVARMLAEPGSGTDGVSVAMEAQPKPIQHPVKFYEKGERPIEFITTRQWFIRILDHKDTLLRQGEKIKWHPAHMKTRYDNWVAGLNYDWCISRQRFFGVPFPVWYKLDEHQQPDFENPIVATSEMLPVDPLSEPPPGFDEAQRGSSGGFIGDPDVMDTWATSSLTPQIVSKWSVDAERHKKLFPMDMRPQSHEIIRTWAFYTIVKAWMHEGEIPWRNVVISGWILDPDRKKMSKSKGNVVTPQHLLDEYSSDAVRYWAARARLGVDTAFDDQVFSAGRKLATKVFNASKFVLSQVAEYRKDGLPDAALSISEELDRALVEQLRGVITQATKSFDAFDYAQALQLAEAAFWSFCDTYLELVKARAYAADEPEQRGSAVRSLEWSLSVFLRLLAPVMPFVTEEVWSWHFAQQMGESSIHRAPWPSVGEVSEIAAPGSEHVIECASEVLAAIHHAKSKAQKSLKWPVASVAVRAKQEHLNAIQAVSGDLVRAGRIQPQGMQLIVGDAAEKSHCRVEVELGEELVAN